jgi:hypothetical protein
VGSARTLLVRHDTRTLHESSRSDSEPSELELEPSHSWTFTRYMVCSTYKHEHA